MERPNPLLTIRHSLHSLAQPLAAVTGLVDLLLLEMDEENELVQDVKLISEQLEQVLRIVEEIRGIAREATADEGPFFVEATPLPKTP